MDGTDMAPESGPASVGQCTVVAGMLPTPSVVVQPVASVATASVARSPAAPRANVAAKKRKKSGFLPSTYSMIRTAGSDASALEQLWEELKSEKEGTRIDAYASTTVDFVKKATTYLKGRQSKAAKDTAKI